MKPLARWQAEIHSLAKAKGWWTDPDSGEPVDPVRRIPEALCLVHSEVSEAHSEGGGANPTSALFAAKP